MVMPSMVILFSNAVIAGNTITGRLANLFNGAAIPNGDPDN